MLGHERSQHWSSEELTSRVLIRVDSLAKQIKDIQTLIGIEISSNRPSASHYPSAVPAMSDLLADEPIPVPAMSDLLADKPIPVPAMSDLLYEPTHDFHKQQTLSQQIDDISKKLSELEEQMAQISQQGTSEIIDRLQQIEARTQQVKTFDESLSDIKERIGNIETQLTQTLDQRFDTLSKQLQARETAQVRRWKVEAKPLINASIKKNMLELETLTKGLIDGREKLKLWLNSQEIEAHLKAADLACKMLNTVIGNVPFWTSIQKLAELRDEHEKEFVKIILNELDEFFKVESQLLEYYRMSDVDTIINKGHEVIAEVLDGKVRYINIHNSIDDLRTAACSLKGNLEKLTSQKRRRIILKLIIGIGGIVVALVNVQAGDVLTPAQQALSGHIGSGIIGAAAAAVWPP